MTNTNNTNVLVRRAAAEGFNFGVVKAALIDCSEESKNGGFEKRDDIISLDVLASEIHGHVRYSAGYMYSGSHWILNGVDLTEFGQILHTHPQENRNYLKGIKELKKLLSRAEIGSRLSFWEDAQCRVSKEFIKNSSDQWVLVEEYCQMWEQWENNTPIFLPAGIREATAKRIGVTASETFHRVFDSVVDEIYSAYY